MIRLQLLGGPTVVGPGITPDAATRLRRAIALLALVAAAAPQAVARDRLVAFLWPESDTDRARNSLRQTLFALRRDLGEDIFLPESVAGLQLDPAHIGVDLWDFVAGLREGQLENAVDAYHGPLLDGFSVPRLEEFSEWVESERARLHRQFVGALDSLAARAEQEGRIDDAVAWRRRGTEADPLSSRVALALLQALVAAGDRTGALAHGTSYERLVRQRLDAEPDASISAFIEELRRNAAVPAAPRPATPVSTQTEIPTGAAAAVAAAAAAVAATPVAAASVPVHARRRVFWLAPALVVAVAVAAGLWFSTADTRAFNTGAPLQFGSGMLVHEGRDMENRMVACEGPGCPDSLPQHAFAVVTHEAYADPGPGMGYIAFAPDAVTIESPGYACCTTATFEREFRTPPKALAATLSVMVHADNQAIVRINGREFGRQLDSLSQENFSSEPELFRVTFTPNTDGVNRLQVVLINRWGASAVAYSAVVTFQMPADTVGRGGKAAVPPAQR